MKISLKILSLAAALTLVPTMAFADTVSITLTAGLLQSRPGVVLPANSTVVVLVDRDGDNSFGLETPALTAGTWMPDGGDAIIARFASLDGGIADQFLNFEISANNSASTIGFGDKLLLVWYETPFNPAAAGPGEGVYFGTYRTDELIDSDFGFSIPAGGAAGNLLALDGSQGGGTPSSALVGQFQTPISAVPEPASLAVLALGGVALSLRRRRA